MATPLPPLLLALFALFSTSKSALFRRAKGIAHGLWRGSFRMDLSAKFGKEIPSRTLRQQKVQDGKIPSHKTKFAISFSQWILSLREGGVNNLLSLVGLFARVICAIRANHESFPRIYSRISGDQFLANGPSQPLPLGPWPREIILLRHPKGT